MERRHFLRSILGVAAATALPSEVWPFRKIFLPASPIIMPGLDEYFQDPMALRLAMVGAIELEAFARAIAPLVMKESILYKHFIKDAELKPFRIPARLAGGFSLVMD